jgi:class 3 adenylate cyclase
LTLATLLESYLGRRSAAPVLGKCVRREMGETNRAVPLYGDLRSFTAPSEALPPQVVIATLGAWFDRVAGAIHVFGGGLCRPLGRSVLVSGAVAAETRVPLLARASMRCGASPAPAPSSRSRRSSTLERAEPRIPRSIKEKESPLKSGV